MTIYLFIQMVQWLATCTRYDLFRFILVFIVKSLM